MKKDKKLKIYEIKEPIYDFTLLILICPEKDFIEYCHKLGEKDIEEDGAKGCYIRIGDKNKRAKARIIHLVVKKDLNTLAHELLHLIFEILPNRAIKLIENRDGEYITDTQEAYCYLFEYLFSEVRKKLGD